MAPDDHADEDADEQQEDAHGREEAHRAGGRLQPLEARFQRTDAPVAAARARRARRVGRTGHAPRAGRNSRTLRAGNRPRGEGSPAKA
eukprot:7344895-Heterocapsa_arctica.AAC.1